MLCNIKENSFNTQSPVSWLIEGVSMYLAERDLVTLFKDISSLSCPGSRICMSYVNMPSLLHAKDSKSAVLQSWQFGTDDIQDFLTRHKMKDLWKIKHIVKVI